MEFAEASSPLSASMRFPFIRLLLNILPREIVATGTRLDMLRGVPVIYSCFIGYDILGHRSGPTARTALRSLRGLIVPSAKSSRPAAV